MLWTQRNILMSMWLEVFKDKEQDVRTNSESPYLSSASTPTPARVDRYRSRCHLAPSPSPRAPSRLRPGRLPPLTLHKLPRPCDSAVFTFLPSQRVWHYSTCSTLSRFSACLFPSPSSSLEEEASRLSRLCCTPAAADPASLLHAGQTRAHVFLHHFNTNAWCSTKHCWRNKWINKDFFKMTTGSTRFSGAPQLLLLTTWLSKHQK